MGKKLIWEAQKTEACEVIPMKYDEWCDDCKHGKSKGIKKGMAMAKAQTPCDVCRFNPPSSADGKPCTMCPAEPSHAEEVKKGEAMAQRWIPVSERLPEDVEVGEQYPTVIFCTKDATYAGFYEHCRDGNWWSDDEDYIVDGVIAWMPLPKPYKGDQG